MNKSSSSNIQVVVRVRPPNNREMEQSQRTIIKVEDTQTMIFDPDEDEDEFFFHGAKQFHRDITRKVNKKLNMEFDRIFDDAANNNDIFESCMKPLVHSVMNGFNCSTFVYGATGAGKTHTMLGNKEQPGITYLTMAYLFEQIESLSAERKFDIGISYLEVYNEQVMNLLTKSGPMVLREDAAGVVVNGLRLLPIFNAEELLNLLALGNTNRTQHPTDANAESSRSHAIFQVHIRMIHKTGGQKNTVKLSMIDLAGSERAASTKGIGQRFKEGASINKSLLALGNCINKLADGAKHIPYRDSNLTRIIKDSLGGNCQTVMIANVSPSSLTYEDTYNTLKYASRAKKIRINIKMNMCKSTVSKEVMVKQMSDQHSKIVTLEGYIKQLESRLASTEQKAAAISGTVAGPDLTAWYAKIDAVFKGLNEAVEHYYTMVSRERVLQFRTQFKQKAKDAMNVLTLDGTELKHDLSRLEASIDRFDKQAESYKQNMATWKTRITDKQSELVTLRKTIDDNELTAHLELYFRCKAFELDSIKTNVKNLHVLKINSIYMTEYHNVLKVLRLSNQIVQHDYFLLRANKLLDCEMQESYEELKRLNQGGARNVKFVDDNADAGLDSLTVVTSDVEKFNFSFCENVDESLGVFTEPKGPAPKRIRGGDSDLAQKLPPIKKLFVDSMGPAAFTMPNIVLDETHVITADDGDTDGVAMNEIETVCKPSVNMVSSLFNPVQAKINKIRIQNPSNKNILSDPNTLYNKVTKLTTHRPMGSSKPATVKVNKENKRFSPIRSRTSPKARTPRNNIASRARQRMLAAASAVAASGDVNPSIRQKYKSVAPK